MIKKKSFIAAFVLSGLLVLATFTSCSDLSESSDGNTIDSSSAVKEEPEWKISLESHTWTYTNARGEQTSMEYGLYIPSAYDEAGEALPLITYIPDSGYIGRTVGDLAESEGITGWITEENMAKNPAVFLAITFSKDENGDEMQGSSTVTGMSDVTVEGSQAAQVVEIVDELCRNYNIDEDRLYLTGQSMGGILDWSLNTAYPEKFAATVYVGCQPGDEVEDDMYVDIMNRAEFLNQKFIYIASRLDSKAPAGQDDIEEALIANGVRYEKYYELDKSDFEADCGILEELFEPDCNIYLIGFPQVSNGQGGMEHLRSFSPAYSIAAIYDWLTAQVK